MRFGKASASKPLMKCRKRQMMSKPERMAAFRDKVGGRPDSCPIGIRHEGGASPNLALAWNVRTWSHDGKGEIQAGGPRKDESTDAWPRGGAARSSDEGAVMGLERRGCIVRPYDEGNRRREDLRG